jgi:hypothetical protein
MQVQEEARLYDATNNSDRIKAYSSEFLRCDLLSPLGGGVYHQVPPSKGKHERAFSALGVAQSKETFTFDHHHGDRQPAGQQADVLSSVLSFETSQ